MADNVKIIDGGGTTSFIRAIGLAGGTYVMYSIPSKVDGTAYSAPATIALSMPVALPTDQIVSTLITNASVTALISNASITANITNASLTANITNASLTALVSGTVTVNNSSLTALVSGTVTINNASVTATLINASVTTQISNASITALISNAFLTTILNTAFFTTGAPTASNTALAVAISPNGLNVNGSGTSAGAAPVVIANDQQALSVIISSKNLANGNSTTLLTPLFTTIDVAVLGTSVIVSTISTAKIRVIALQLTNSTATGLRWKGDATFLTGTASFTTNSGYVLPFNPVGWFETAANSALLLAASGATSLVGGSLTYVII